MNLQYYVCYFKFGYTFPRLQISLSRSTVRPPLAKYWSPNPVEMDTLLSLNKFVDMHTT